MTVRLEDPKLNDTTLLLVQVLHPVLAGDRVLFLCPAGEGAAVAQRLRMQLSRQRKKMQDRRVKFVQFMLYSNVHSETHNGVRYDAVVMWKVQSKVQQAAEEIDALLSEGTK
jgi:predicted proteasome-type protease